MKPNHLIDSGSLASLPTRAERRRRFNDSAVYDAANVMRAVMDGATLDDETRRRFVKDSLAFYVNELDRLDPQLVTPLYNVTWADDIDAITVAMGEESTSFIKQSFGAVGSGKATGKPWLNTNSNTLPGVSIDGERLVKPLRPCGMEISVTEFEAARAQLTGRPIDAQKIEALNAHYQLGVDEQVYIGDDELGVKGLVNQPSSVISTANAANGAFSGNTAAEIIADLQETLRQAWENTAYNVVPTDLLLPPAQFALIHTKQMDSINETVASYFTRTCLATQRNGTPIKIRPCKRLVGIGAGNTDRMVAYSRKKEFVRFPMLPIRRVKTYDQAIAFHASYLWVLGEVEFPRPETVIYRDAI